MGKKWRTIHIDELAKMTFEEIAEEQIAAFLELKETNAGAAALFVNYQRRKMQNSKDIYMRELSKVYERKCFCCGSEDRLVIDHIIPVSLGGCTTWENLQILCTPCNSSKRTRVVDYRRKAKKPQDSMDALKATLARDGITFSPDAKPMLQEIIEQYGKKPD